MKNRFVLTIGLILCFFFSAYAKHIIGGVITYEHKGNGKYVFTMRIYRDCNGGGAPFDGDAGDRGAVIGIFKETNGSYQSVRQLNELLAVKNSVSAPSYPCISLPPNICVEEGVYEFEYTIPDFPSKSSYHIVYQRCCRNTTITNIITPQNSGATYEIVITPEAQAVGSSSPVFKNFPPTIICANVPITFDHSAMDKDGDSLYYRFCNPLYGGGPDVTGAGFSDCLTGARPDPACPPPYKPVIFKGGYSDINPLGFNSMVINGKTGLLTGEVKQLGQYVVGICVEEYRNGKLLGTVFRDFQFNIATCNVLVDANIANDTIIGKRLVINSCGSSNVTFDNRSTDKSKIQAYLWEFNILGQTQTSKEERPSIAFPGLGKYTGRLIANPGLKPCTDTADFEVNIYPDINANFKYVYDTCVAGPVQFTDLSSTGSGQMKSWKWDYKDGKTDKIQNPAHTYKLPGEYKASLTVQDINGCKETTTRVIRYFPVPSLLIVDPDTSQGCQPLTIKFNNLSTPIDETYKFEWDLGDGSKSSALSPTHTYEDVGSYSVSLNLTSPIGCKTSASFPNLILVKGSPVANYTYSPDKLSNFESVATFTDKSKDAVKWTWQFGKGEGTSASRNPIYTFRDTGLHEVRQIVTHPSGCTDTLTKLIDVVPLVTYFLPNAFTPNFDGINEEFKGVGNLFGMNDFHMGIWNRWGEKVFDTSDPREGWNGKVNNTGSIVPDGVYVYYVTFIGPRNKLFSYKGFATLLR
jgi:gliding motility-associated-like protein